LQLFRKRIHDSFFFHVRDKRNRHRAPPSRRHGQYKWWSSARAETISPSARSVPNCNAAWA
jgi:hypothetical protein